METAPFSKPAVSLEEIPILSVSEISQTLKRFVEGNFNKIRVQGEISGLKRHTSGHSYFALKDKDAVLDGICWRGTALGITLEEGLEVIVQGRLTTYPGRSKYQIVIESAKAAGQGALLKLLMERKAKLEAEGLFERKRPLPSFPNRIGIITSATGAVIQDILHRLNDRYPCEVIVWPVLVQGPGAADQVTNAIDGFNRLPPHQLPDLLIVARGGGSLEDLWTFNEENVIRATANSQIPIISAIGHETDTTLIDYASDLRAPTPTAAAELATPVLSQILYTLELYSERSKSLMNRHLENQFVHVRGLGRGLPDPKVLLETATIRLDDWVERFHLAQLSLLKNKYNILVNIALRLRHPKQTLDIAATELKQHNQNFIKASTHYFDRYEQNLRMISMCLEQGSYQRVLERGFCWISDGNTVLTSVSDFSKHMGKVVSLNFADGEVKIKPQPI
ncbi:MAG: exodeoxyribonuclease VII large subunit [Alphaproteobacteria bacterium]|nr:exodeoxyribonuclease VII large subunit [Alphaproteobacteria bacterium]